MRLTTALTLFQEIPEVVTTQYEKISNPILAILLFVVFVALYFMWKQNSKKDDYIKELNALILEHSLKNVEIIKGLQHSIDIDSANHKALEDLARENNNLLQTMMRDIKN